MAVERPLVSRTLFHRFSASTAVSLPQPSSTFDILLETSTSQRLFVSYSNIFLSSFFFFFFQFQSECLLRCSSFFSTLYNFVVCIQPASISMYFSFSLFVSWVYSMYNIYTYIRILGLKNVPGSRVPPNLAFNNYFIRNIFVFHTKRLCLEIIIRYRVTNR